MVRQAHHDINFLSAIFDDKWINLCYFSNHPRRMKNIGQQIQVMEITGNRCIRRRYWKYDMRSCSKPICNNKLCYFALFGFYLPFFTSATAVFHLFHLLAQVALTAAVFHWLVFVFTKILGNVGLVHLVVPPQAQVHQYLGEQRNKYYYGDEAFHWCAKLAVNNWGCQK